MIASILTRLFGGNDDETDGLAALQSALAERQTTLDLSAEYERPTINRQGEPTAMFPCTLYEGGEPYGAHAKEFAIPDNGLDDEDAPLTRFLNRYGIESIEDLGSIQGTETTATLKDNGEVEVGAGEVPASPRSDSPEATEGEPL
jgi:hypothetical protein